ncbi:MAG: hypothetical protein IKU94_05235 [Bacteroidaceae bacterium]|nr:hypothetical protein [Bacteroidaceae bacterium]
MKQYTKTIDGKSVIKPRNQIVLHGTRTIKDKDGNDKEIKTQIINPKEEMLFADGWEIYEPSQPEESEEKLEHRAEQARADLADSDYKVIKCMEAYLCGEPLPYDIAELHKERDAQRLTINELEEGL